MVCLFVQTFQERWLRRNWRWLELWLWPCAIIRHTKRPWQQQQHNDRGSRHDRRVSSPLYVYFILFYLSYYTNIFLGDGSNSGRARDTTCLKPLVIYYYYITLIFVGKLSVSTPGSDAGSERCIWHVVRALSHLQYHYWSTNNSNWGSRWECVPQPHVS